MVFHSKVVVVWVTIKLCSSVPASGSNTLSVEVEASNSQQEMDLDSISLHSGDYLENITSDDHDPHPEDSETIVVSNADVDAAESQVDFLEKENNLLMSTEETGKEQCHNMSKPSSKL